MLRDARHELDDYVKKVHTKPQKVRPRAKAESVTKNDAKPKQKGERKKKEKKFVNEYHPEPGKQCRTKEGTSDMTQVAHIMRETQNIRDAYAALFEWRLSVRDKHPYNEELQDRADKAFDEEIIKIRWHIKDRNFLCLKYTDVWNVPFLNEYNVPEGPQGLPKRTMGVPVDYLYSDIPVGTHYAHFPEFLDSNPDPTFTYTLSYADHIVATTVLGNCFDIPLEANPNQVVGYIWYQGQPQDIKTKYDAFDASPLVKHKMEPVQRIPLSTPTPFTVTRRKVRTLLKSNGKGKPFTVLEPMNNITRATTKEDEQFREEIGDLRKMEEHMASMRINETVEPRAAGLIAKNIMLPDDPLDKTPLSRFSDSYTSMPTAATRPLSQQVLSVSGTTDGLTLTNPDFVAVLRRDPVVNTIQYEANPTQQVSTYIGYFVNDTANANDVPTVSGPATMEFTGSRWLTPSYMVATTTYQPHGKYWYGLRQKTGAYYFYANTGHTISVNINNTSGNSINYGASLFRDAAGEDVEQATVIQTYSTGGAFSTTFQIRAPGYYAIRIFMYCTGTCQGSVSMAISNVTASGNTGSSTLAHKPVIDFNTNYTRTQGMRVLGGVLMLSNFTNLYQVVGVMSGTIVPGNRPLMDLLANKDSSKIVYASTSKLIGQENSENGMRIWLKPTGAADYLINENVTLRNGILIDAHGDLYTASSYAIIYYQNQSSSAIQLNMQSCLRMEYYTQDNWTEVRQPAATPEEWTFAHEIVKDAPCVTANPTHWLLAVKSILDGIHKYAGRVGGAIGSAAGSLSGMLG